MISTANNINILLRRLTAADNSAIARVIREVSAEFGLTADRGYTVADPHLDQLYGIYSQPDSAYWIVEREGCVVGGGGVAPLQCCTEAICELQKMYFLPIARGMGLARTLALKAIEFARQHGYQHCYLETTATLSQAIKLYEQLGFRHIDNAMGCTGHDDCEIRMLKTL